MLNTLILLVEDHEDNRNIYRTILEHSGFQVVIATDGREGIRLARDSCPDLILMDLSIPVCDGWEATHTLKSDPTTSHIPIVALTAHALEEDRARALAAGCAGYLTKPVKPSVVIDEVRRLLPRLSAGTEPV